MYVLFHEATISIFWIFLQQQINEQQIFLNQKL